MVDILDLLSEAGMSFVLRLFVPLTKYLVGAAVAVTMLVACAHQAPQPADTVFRGGYVYTVDPEKPWASAVAVRDGAIVYVGNDAEVLQYMGPTTTVRALDGRMLLPGFHDAHAHPVSGGANLTYLCNLSGLLQLSQMLAKLEECAMTLQPGEWLQGSGWSTGSFPAGNPHLDMLDSVPGDHPIYLTDEGGHSAWANKEALELAGIDASTPDPHAGIIMRDVDGTPSGTLRELAMGLVASHVPPPQKSQQLDALRAAMKHANRFGITSMVDAFVTPDLDDIYLELLRDDELSVRFHLAFYLAPDWDEDMDTLLARRKGDGNLLHSSQIKLWMDGVMEAQTAAVKTHYVGQPENLGLLSYSDEWLSRVVPALEAEGFQLHLHTLGDAAVAQALTALELSREVNKAPNRRPYLIHNYLIDPADYPRIKAADATLNFTMLWDQMDPVMVNATQPYLTPQQLADLMPMGQVHEAGLVVTGGSDWPVTQISPLSSIEVAVTGKSAPYHLGMPTVMEQPPMVGERVKLDTMIRAYTLNAAYAARQEDVLGSVSVGKRADLIVLEKNLFKIHPEDIAEVEIDLTMLDGRVVFERAKASLRY